jgi:two-component system, sensor histidine kinase LadS
MKRLCCLLLLLLFQLSLHAGQARYEVDTAFFHDDRQTHTLESAQAQAFKPYQGQLRLGFTGGETWIRIRLKDHPASAPSDPIPSLVFRVESYSLDRLDFYQQTAGNWTHQRGGELQLQKNNFCIELQHCFEFNASNTGHHYAYLKVQTTGVRIVRTDVMTADKAFKSSIGVIKSVNTALNLSIALWLLSVTFLFFERSRILLVFCGFQTTVVLSICAFSGALQQWWGFMSAVSPNTMTGLALVMRMAMTVLLAWVILDCLQAPQGLQQMGRRCSCGVRCQCPACFLGVRNRGSPVELRTGFYKPVHPNLGCAFGQYKHAWTVDFRRRMVGRFDFLCFRISAQFG